MLDKLEKLASVPLVTDSQWLGFSVCGPLPSSLPFSLTNYFAILSLDLNEAVPETERLDSKALKTRAQLSVKNRRQRPTRTRLYDSVSSTDGEDSLERKVSTLNGWQTLAECRCPPVYLLNVIAVLLICALLGRKSPKFVFNCYMVVI